MLVTWGRAQGMNFGIDPNLDPELALALRVSLEEERARQEQAQAATGGDTAMSDAQPASGASSDPTPATTPFLQQTIVQFSLSCGCTLFEAECGAIGSQDMHEACPMILITLDEPRPLESQERVSRPRMVRAGLWPPKQLTGRQKWRKRQSRWQWTRTTCCSKRWPCLWQVDLWRLTLQRLRKQSRQPPWGVPCLTAMMRSCRMPSGCPCQRCSLERKPLLPLAL